MVFNFLAERVYLTQALMQLNISWLAQVLCLNP